MEQVIEAIGINKGDTSGGIILIEEQHNSNANFLLNAITSYCQEKNNKICFVLFHNTFGHYHNIGMKLGYNLRKACESNVEVIEPFKLVTKNIEETNQLIQVKELVKIIHDHCFNKNKQDISQKTFIIIEDISHLFDLGFNIDQVWLFLRYIRSFVYTNPLITLCISCHTYKNYSENCLPNVIVNGLRYFSQLSIRVQPLDTGFSKTVSGKMIVSWKSDKEKIKFNWPDQMTYLFKLLDREVKLFEPGSNNIM